MNFFVMGLPRSRTAWLANFLTAGDTLCLHEPLAQVASLNELPALYPAFGRRGAADTVAPLLWRPIADRWPGAKFVIVLRSMDAVQQSVRALGLSDRLLAKSFLFLHTAARELANRAIVVPFERMNDMLPNIWQHTHENPYDARRGAMLAQMNITRDLDSFGADAGRLTQLMTGVRHAASSDAA